MNQFQAWDIVVVDFPFSDKAAGKVRPALLVSSSHLAQTNNKFWLMMITSAVGTLSDGDIEIADFLGVGLPKPSLIRCSKITTLETKGIRKSIGHLPASLREKVRLKIDHYLAA